MTRFICFLIAILMPSVAYAEVERYGVIIGNNAGAPEDVELRYAENDASKLHDTLRGVGGFTPTNLVLLKGENADTVRRAIIAVNERVRASTASNGQALLIVYYSGHADAAALHLGRTMLQIRELEQLVRGSAATLRLLVLDSCRSGSLTRVKGGTSAAPVSVRVAGFSCRARAFSSGRRAPRAKMRKSPIRSAVLSFRIT